MHTAMNPRPGRMDLLPSGTTPPGISCCVLMSYTMRGDVAALGLCKGILSGLNMRGIKAGRKLAGFMKPEDRNCCDVLKWTQRSTITNIATDEDENLIFINNWQAYGQ